MSSDALEALCIHAIGGGWGQEVQDEKHTERVAVIRGTDIPRASFGDLEGIPFRWETPSKVKSRLLQAEDIVLEISGGSAASGQHTGRALFVTSDLLDRLGGRVIPASFCRLLRLDSRKVDPKFICYQIAGMHLTGEISEFENQSTGIANFQFARFISDVSPALDALHDQREVAAVLGALDDRITLLRETNKTLEAIAQALFKSWFVDFDPVRAKMEGRQPEGMDEATAALFPDSFEESELGLVPRGWRVGCINDLCDAITNGGTPSRSKEAFWAGGEISWYKTGELADGFLLKPSEFITDIAVQSTSVKVLPANSVLMAIYAAPTVGRLGVLTRPAAFNQACTGMVANEQVGTWFLYWSLYFGRDWFNSRANGAAQQNISKAIVSSYKVVIPDLSVLGAFNDVAEAIHHSIRNNSVQAESIANLRDTLLPRLISGQLRLPESEAEIETLTA